MKLVTNAQSIIDISRLRLCSKSHNITRNLWEKVIKKLESISPELVASCVPNCIYRGYCSEPKPCGLIKTEKFYIARKVYVGNRPTVMSDLDYSNLVIKLRDLEHELRVAEYSEDEIIDIENKNDDGTITNKINNLKNYIKDNYDIEN